MKKNRVICQKWEESERGWGTRPDGYSLHLSEDDRKVFIEEYWDRMPNEVPEEYSKPCGTAYQCEVDEKIYQEVVNSQNGIRFCSNDYPNGGADGWMNIDS